MLLSLLRDGLSPEFRNGHFFKDFLEPRFPQFASIHEQDSLREKMKDAYKLDEDVIRSKMKGQIFWIGIDETPDSMNRALVHGIASFVDCLEDLKATPAVLKPDGDPNSSVSPN